MGRQLISLGSSFTYEFAAIRSTEASLRASKLHAFAQNEGSLRFDTPVRRYLEPLSQWMAT
jgi:hypothetical protein